MKKMIKTKEELEAGSQQAHAKKTEIVRSFLLVSSYSGCQLLLKPHTLPLFLTHRSDLP